MSKANNTFCHRSQYHRLSVGLNHMIKKLYLYDCSCQFHNYGKQAKIRTQAGEVISIFTQGKSTLETLFPGPGSRFFCLCNQNIATIARVSTLALFCTAHVLITLNCCFQKVYWTLKYFFCHDVHISPPHTIQNKFHMNCVIVIKLIFLQFPVVWNQKQPNFFAGWPKNPLPGNSI